MPPQFSSVTTWGHGKAEPQRPPLQTTASPLLAVLEFLILHPFFHALVVYLWGLLGCLV